MKTTEKSVKITKNVKITEKKKIIQKKISETHEPC